MKFLKILIHFSLFIFLNSSDECEEIFKDNIHPSECCNIPSREILESHQQKCKAICKNDDSNLQAGCCEINCIYSVTGVLKNGELVKDAVIELYENFLQSKGAGKFDKWITIVENSIKKCVLAVQKVSDSLVCNIPEYFMDFLDCIDSQNFLNCPNFKYTKACNKTRKIFEKENQCGKKFNGVFVVNYQIWNKKS
ncbi:hypothetical protein PVAND_014405 [Polypedilum vanderplanki]|uniref:Uncharacterized protein n=1 Tax=Polypedilum vanderplanki TaxID=319348 RepID=A0A9J6B9S2_POLVA|nr:hypothetical protein PVAND_014405 [Polypedilum vanderplanki]